MAHKPDTAQFRRAIYNSREQFPDLPRWGDRLRLLFENGRNRSSARSITAARNMTEIPLIALRAERRSRRARRNYSRRPSRDDDNSRFRLRSLIETRPSLLFPTPRA